MVLSEKVGEEKMRQNIYSRDLLLAGFGYRKENLMFDIYFSGGGESFKGNYFRGWSKLSIVASLYYRLNQKNK